LIFENSEVKLAPALENACFECILFKKAYHLKWPKIDKNGLFTPYTWPEYGLFVAGWIYRLHLGYHSSFFNRYFQLAMELGH